MISRPINPYWGKTRPHAGRFQKLVEEVEADFQRAAERAERVAHCLMMIDPTPPSDSCEVALPTMEVTPGGLTYQDAALQCLLGGARGSLEFESRMAKARALYEFPDRFDDETFEERQARSFTTNAREKDSFSPTTERNEE